MEPGKPRVLQQKLQEALVGGDLAKNRFVGSALRIHERLVQVQQGMSHGLELALMRSFRSRRCWFIRHAAILAQVPALRQSGDNRLFSLRPEASSIRSRKLARCLS